MRLEPATKAITIEASPFVETNKASVICFCKLGREQNKILYYSIELWAYIKSVIHRKAHSTNDSLVTEKKRYLCIRTAGQIKNACFRLSSRLEELIAAEDGSLAARFKESSSSEETV